MTRRVPKFVSLPRIPDEFSPQQRAYFEALHAVLRMLIEPLSELGGRTSISLDDHITNTSRDDHTQYLNVTRHDTTTRHPLGSVIPVSDVPPPAVGANSQTGNLNAVARADHTHAHGDLSTLTGTFHHWDQITGKPDTFPPSPHASTHGRGESDTIAASRLHSGLDADKPATGNTEGDVWWATDTDKLYVWDGTAWKEIGAGATLTMPSGYLCKDYDPPLQMYYPSATILATYDVGANAQILPLRAELPPAVMGNPGMAQPAIRFVFHDETQITIVNTDTSSGLVKNFEDLIAEIATVGNNGKSIQKVIFLVIAPGYPVEADLGVFKTRNWVAPRGTGVMP